MAHAASRSQTVQGCGGGAGQQDGAHGLGAAGSRRHLSETCAGGSAVRGCRWENEAAYVRSRTAGVMTTLMRNGRDRRSENPLLGQARIERAVLVGTDQRITSGPAATAAASHRGKPPSENRPYTWLHPNASQKSQIRPLHRGRRPYMAPSGGSRQCRMMPAMKAKRTSADADDDTAP